MGFETSNMQTVFTWVIKTSKLCNLRCKYCYEFSELNDPSKMSISNLSILFNKAEEVAQIFDTDSHFVWHGGEPLLLSDSFYENIISSQKKIFQRKILNSVQTNLTLNPTSRTKTLRKLKIGVSFDPIGDLRVTKNGESSAQSVLNNMAILRQLEIKFACITVLNQINFNYQEKVFNFFNKLNIDYRLLPYYRQDNVFQYETYSIKLSETAQILKVLFDIWLSKGNGISVQPLYDYLNISLRYLGCVDIYRNQIITDAN